MSHSTRAAGGAELAPTTLASLPQPLALRIFAALPPDARARCACVSRAWRALVADESLWLRLDLKPARPSMRALVTDAFLRGAAARACGRLRALDLRCCIGFSHDTMLAVVAANAGSLRELRCASTGDPIRPWCVDLEALLRAAPALRVLEAFAACATVEEARRALQYGLPAGPLQDSSMTVTCMGADEAALLALAADLSQQVAIKCLTLLYTNLGEMPAVLDAIADAFLAASTLRTLHLLYCSLSPAAGVALARMLRDGGIVELYIGNSGAQLLDAPAARLLAAALRDNTQLRKLSLCSIGLFREPAAAVELLGALTGHPTVRELSLRGNFCFLVAAEAGCAAALAGLVAANSAALHTLDVSYCRIDDASMRPLLEALPGNAHLHVLKCSSNYMSAAFARDVLLPAMRANTSLRSLYAHGFDYTMELSGQQSADALVAERAAGLPAEEDDDDVW